MKLERRKYRVASGLLLVAVLLHANHALGWPEEGRAAISPTLTETAPGETLTFNVIMLPRRLQPAWPAQNVTWSVNGVTGGNEKLGFIDENGVYRAPKEAPASGELHVCAEVPEASNRFLSATVRMAGADQVYRSAGHWDNAEIEKADLTDPRRIVQDSRGRFLIADMTRARVSHFSKDGEYLGSFGLGPDGKEIAHEGMCVVAVDPTGRVFAADRKTGPPRVSVFDPDGNWLFGFAPKGAYAWMVAEPSGLAFHPDGRIFLADMDATRVAVYDSKGNLLGLLREHAPKGNSFNAPSDVAVDASGDLFVSSLHGPCEKLCADSGERLFAFAYPRPPKGPMFFDDLCVDRWGNVFLAVRCAADPVESGPEGGGRAAVLKYTNHGDFLAEIPLSAEAPGRAAVAVDGHGRLYVAYSETDRAGVELFVQE